MANCIIKKLLKYNKEFSVLYRMYESKGKIKTFDIFDEQFQNTMCSKRYEDEFMSFSKAFNLKYIYDNDYNTSSLYLTMLYTFKALIGTNIGGDIVDSSTKVMMGKNYLTRNFPNVYDCISVWIETDNHIIDPMLGIVVDKSIANKMLYSPMTQIRRINLNFGPDIMSYNMIEIKEHYRRKEGVIESYTPPRTMKDLMDNNAVKFNNSTALRDFIRVYKKPVYQRLMTMRALGEIKDLTEDMSIYKNIYINKEFNPELTLDVLLRKGVNYGRCGIFAKLFSNTVYGDIKHEYHIGRNTNIAGSKNSYDGNHAWLEVGDKLIDTSLMMEIPLKYKSLFGYETWQKEDIRGPFSKKTYFGERMHIDREIFYADVIFDSQKNGARIFDYDFSEDIPDLVENTGMDKFSYETNFMGDDN